MIIVHDFILNNTMDNPLFPALFSLNMLLGTHQSQSYSEKQIMDMLCAAGVKQIKRVPFNTPNDFRFPPPQTTTHPLAAIFIFDPSKIEI